MAALLALASALCWGSADYLGGVQSRRVSSVAVALWSQVLGGVVLLAIALLDGDSPAPESLAWGAAAGVCTGSALILFYRGLSGGAMAIVAPISACGAIVPVVASIITGDPPSLVQYGGIALCIAGAVAVSIPRTEGRYISGRPLLAVALGASAALGFGLFYLLVDRANGAGGTALWVIVAARAGSSAAILVVAASTRTALRIPGQIAPAILLTGILDTSANVLFAIAASRGDLGVVAVLGSLYPVTTVALAMSIGGERVTRLRVLGGAVALAGVAVLAAG